MVFKAIRKIACNVMGQEQFYADKICGIDKKK